ncbi:hypothetical protein HYX13_02610 [Candidatus Woesearchaeota archaeon]|nr:hypothetical protein [Candidatus Woesearchaeota archaeon]
MSLSNLSSLLLQAGKIAEEVHKKFFHQKIELQVSKKSDNLADVVTDADKEAEQLLRTFFAENLPDYNIFGEEFGATYNGNGKIIVIDPLDGTLSFTQKLPGFGTVIGIYENGENIAGYVSNTLKGISYLATADDLQKGFHHHDSAEGNAFRETGILQDAIYLSSAFYRDFETSKVSQRLFKEEFPSLPFTMGFQESTNRCKVHGKEWSASLHRGLAWERDCMYSKPILVCKPELFDGMMRVLEKLRSEIPGF